MKTACASVAVMLLATTFAFDAQSDEPPNPTKTVAGQTQLRKQLIQTLEEIDKLRLAEYQERGASDCVQCRHLNCNESKNSEGLSSSLSFETGSRWPPTKSRISE